MRSLKASFMSLCLTVAVTGVSAATPSAYSPPPSGNEVANGDLLWAAGRLDEAEKAFAHAFKANPQLTEAGMKLAGIRLSRQNYPGAIETYRRVIGIGPPNARAWIGMGLAQLHTGKHALASAAFEAAVKIEPARKRDLDLLIAKTAR